MGDMQNCINSNITDKADKNKDKEAVILEMECISLI